MIIKAAKRIFNSDKICRSYSDLNFGVTFLEHSVYNTILFIVKLVNTITRLVNLILFLFSLFATPCTLSGE